MIVPLTRREIEYLLADRGRAFWPDEERVLRKLRASLEAGEPPALSRLQVQMVRDWVDERSSSGFGARARTPEEQIIDEKLRAALARAGEAGVG
jgi:hypothetical protein